MALTRLDRGEKWFGFFLTKSQFDCNDPNSPLLNIIDGGLGHDLAAFHAWFPSLPGRLILQDLALEIKNIKDLPPTIEWQIHDLFTPQPVKGTRAYCLLQVLHDFPDQAAIPILKDLGKAMTKESVPFLNENFLPETGACLNNSEIGSSMMSILSSMERTEKHWRKLLEEAGLEVVKIWMPEIQLVASETLFEAVKKE